MTQIQKNTERIILGVDPGTNYMGYGLLKICNKNPEVLFSGVLEMQKLGSIYLKYQKIFQKILHIVDTYRPDELAIEAQFYGKNIQSMLKLGRAQGVAIAAALQRDIPIFEYSPRKIKMAVTGTGTASKEQIAALVQRFLKLDDKARSFDETDALAIALCHFFQKNLPQSEAKVKNWKDFVKKNPGRVK